MGLMNFEGTIDDLEEQNAGLINVDKEFSSFAAVPSVDCKKIKLQPISRERAQQCLDRFIGINQVELKTIGQKTDNELLEKQYSFNSKGYLDTNSLAYIVDETLKLAVIESLISSRTSSNSKIRERAAILAERYVNTIQDKYVGKIRKNVDINVIPSAETVQEIGQSVNSGFASAIIEDIPSVDIQGKVGSNMSYDQNGGEPFLGNQVMESGLPIDTESYISRSTNRGASHQDIEDVVRGGMENVISESYIPSNSNRGVSHQDIEGVARGGMENVISESYIPSNSSRGASRQDIKDVVRGGMENVRSESYIPSNSSRGASRQDIEGVVRGGMENVRSESYIPSSSNRGASRQDIEGVVRGGMENVRSESYIPSSSNRGASRQDKEGVVNDGLQYVRSETDILNKYGQSDSYLSHESNIIGKSVQSVNEVNDVLSNVDSSVYGNGKSIDLNHARASRTGTAAKIGRFDASGELLNKNDAREYNYVKMSDDEIQQSRDLIEYDKYENEYKRQIEQAKKEREQNKDFLAPAVISFTDVFKPATLENSSRNRSESVGSYNNVKKNDYVDIEIPSQLTSDFEDLSAKDMYDAISDPDIKITADDARGMRERILNLLARQQELTTSARDASAQLKRTQEEREIKAEAVGGMLQKLLLYRDAVAEDCKRTAEQLGALNEAIKNELDEVSKYDKIISELNGLIDTDQIDLNMPRGK